MVPVEGMEITATDFSARLMLDDSHHLVATLIGTADMRVWAMLKSFLKKLHEEALRSHAKSIVVLRFESIITA